MVFAKESYSFCNSEMPRFEASINPISCHSNKVLSIKHERSGYSTIKLLFCKCSQEMGSIKPNPGKMFCQDDYLSPLIGSIWWRLRGQGG